MRHYGKQVHDEIMDAPVAGMHQLRHIFEHIVERFYYASLAEHYLVVQRHQALFHIGAKPCHDMDSVVPQMSEKRLVYITLVGVKFTEYLVCQCVNYRFLTVIDIGACQHKIHNFAFLVAEKMRFEANIPSHRALDLGGDTLEYLHTEFPLVVYHWKTGAVNETYACAFSETGKAKEHCQCNETTWHDFHKSIV